MKENGSIGVFDSGIGGITVLNEIIKILPNEKYIYYSDSINNPYGDRPEDEIKRICCNIVDKLINMGSKIIVVACNTASARAVDYLREKYKDIKFIAIEPAYKMVHDYAENKPTLIMATKGTIESEKFNLLLKKYDNHKTYLLACHGLADVIEEGNNEKIEKYLNDNLGEYKGKVENVVLGCTHYPLVENKIKDVLGNVNFFNGASRLAIHLKEVLEEENLLDRSGNFDIEFIDSSSSKEKEERFFKLLEK